MADGLKSLAIGGPAKVQSVAAIFNASLTVLMAKMGACHPHFVRCIKPNGSAMPSDYIPDYVLCQLRYVELVSQLLVPCHVATARICGCTGSNGRAINVESLGHVRTPTGTPAFLRRFVSDVKVMRFGLHSLSSSSNMDSYHDSLLRHQLQVARSAYGAPTRIRCKPICNVHKLSATLAMAMHHGAG